MEALFGPELLADSGGLRVATQAALHTARSDSAVVMLYFSASWCGPCVRFTPQLVQAYERLLARGDAVEVVLVSADRTQEAFAAYHNKMPFVALPFEDRQRAADLQRRFGVQGYPSLVIIRASDGEVLTRDGRSALMNDWPAMERYPWENYQAPKTELFWVMVMQFLPPLLMYLLVTWGLRAFTASGGSSGGSGGGAAKG